MAVKLVSLQVYRALTKASQKTLSRAAKIVSAMGGGRTLYRKGKGRKPITISRKAKIAVVNGRVIIRDPKHKDRRYSNEVAAAKLMAQGF